jgi:bifunctional non-homologous end joining protein LigD
MAKAKVNPRSQSQGKSTKAKPSALGVEEFLALKQPKGDLTVEVEGQQVSLTSLDRVYWPDEKLTKFELLCYYLQVSAHLMPFLKNRPAILQRWPRGVNAPMFFQQDLTNPPPFIKTVHLTNQEGRELDYAVFTTTASLLYFVNLGTIEQHPWNSTVAKLDKPDWIAIDLDPKQASWQHVLEVALITKSVCDELGLEAFPKTSGSSGIHIYVPLKPTAGYDRVAEIANLLAGEVTQRVPQIATLQRALAKRKKEQVYVDWMQNARGKSLAAVLTARAKPKATVSMPLTWKQIEQGVKISDFTVKNVPALLKKSGNPWADFFDSRQKLKLT